MVDVDAVRPADDVEEPAEKEISHAHAVGHQQRDGTGHGR
jgi:hypothetical protein